jgi:excisionase family DNA binding protein
MYVKPKEAAKYYGVSIQTLRRWARNEKVQFIRTDGNHRRYLIKNEEKTKKIIYARVSSQKQKSNLQNQVKYLKKRYPKYELITDIGSGINFKRKGLQRILDGLFDGTIKEVVVTTQDRLVRFRFDLFKYIFIKVGSKLTVINTKKSENDESELSEDLLSIITVFTARHYGRRRYNSDKKNKNISIKKTKTVL